MSLRGKFNAALHPRDANGRFKSKGAADRAISKHKKKARKHDAKASAHRQRARGRIESDRAYVRETGDRGTAKDRQKLASRVAKDRARARKQAEKAVVQRATAETMRLQNQTPAQRKAQTRRDLAALLRLEAKNS